MGRTKAVTWLWEASQEKTSASLCTQPALISCRFWRMWGMP